MGASSLEVLYAPRFVSNRRPFHFELDALNGSSADAANLGDFQNARIRPQVTLDSFFELFRYPRPAEPLARSLALLSAAWTR